MITFVLKADLSVYSEDQVSAPLELYVQRRWCYVP